MQVAEVGEGPARVQQALVVAQARVLIWRREDAAAERQTVKQEQQPGAGGGAGGGARWSWPFWG